MGLIASQITSLMNVYSTVYSDADQRKYQSSASLAFVRGIHRGPVNSPHKLPVTRKMFSFDDVIMSIPMSNPCSNICYSIHVPGWLLKWLNLITAHGSVSNKPGSVTWLATKYLKTVSWRDLTEKLTTLRPQNISFWPKIYIPSSYFTILMPNCLENTLKLQFDSYVTAVKFLG